MDPRHSHYVQTIIGDTNGPPRLSDRRPDGESWYIRVHDAAQDLPEPARTTALESVRIGPEALVDILPDGRTQAAKHPMDGGDDSIPTLTDDTYIGVDDPSPENRTGLHSLRNIDEISIVACPGTDDGGDAECADRPLRADALSRSRFSTARGRRRTRSPTCRRSGSSSTRSTPRSIIPWLLIPDPYPMNLSQIADYPIPPSRPHARRLCAHGHRARRAQGAGERSRARHHRAAAALEQGAARHSQPVSGQHQRHPRLSRRQPRYPRVRRARSSPATPTGST